MIEIDLLLVGGDTDFNLNHILQEAQKNNIVARTCYTGMNGIPEINLDIKNNIFNVNGHDFKTKALFIRPDVMTYQASKNIDHHRLASDWFDIFIGWALANDSIKILNRGYYNRNKINKVTNLLIAKKLGINIPETYFTNSLDFMNKKNDGEWIEKPVHGGKHTILLDMGSKKAEKNNVSMCPITLQKKMEKPELRFFRSGNAYRAFTMDSPSLDYRENQDATVVEVPFPEQHKEKFIQMTDILGLDFAAADYITDPVTGELTFLEVNSGPMFTAFDIAAKGGLCQDMFKALLG